MRFSYSAPIGVDSISTVAAECYGVGLLGPDSYPLGGGPLPALYTAARGGGDLVGVRPIEAVAEQCGAVGASASDRGGGSSSAMVYFYISQTRVMCTSAW
eukprot:COSAG01_NODE_4122_length_5331_cov_11.476873_1_plen_99_part_10